jgi:hypothetical protein
MMLPGTLLIGLLLGGLSPAPAAGAESDTLRSWQTPATAISSDPLGQFYIVRGSLVVRYDSNGDSTCSWSEASTGPVTLIDSGDPMRILIYQKDFNLLRFLNNRLAPISEAIRLDDLGISNPLAIAAAREGGFWVLDGFTMRLRHIGPQLNTVVESMPVDLPAGSAAAACRMAEAGDRIYLLLPGLEIRVFDLFANPLKRIPVKAIDFRPYGNSLLLVRPEAVTIRKDPVTEEEPVFLSPGREIRQACLLPQKLLLSTSAGVYLLSR